MQVNILNVLDLFQQVEKRHLVKLALIITYVNKPDNPECFRIEEDSSAKCLCDETDMDGIYSWLEGYLQA